MAMTSRPIVQGPRLRETTRVRALLRSTRPAKSSANAPLNSAFFLCVARSSRFASIDASDASVDWNRVTSDAPPFFRAAASAISVDVANSGQSRHVRGTRGTQHGMNGEGRVEERRSGPRETDLGKSQHRRVVRLAGAARPTGTHVRRGGRVVRQGSAKPCTPVQFRSPPRTVRAFR
jgi:hypothetical protein